MSLDLIAENLETIVDGYNSLRTHGDTMFDERHRLTKNPAINLINNSQNWIQKQLKLMGWVSSGKEAEMLQKKKLDNWEAELCGD